MKVSDIIARLERAKAKLGQWFGEAAMEFAEEWGRLGFEDACEEACDILYDYEKAAGQNGRLIAKYETANSVIRRANGGFVLWQCPECHSFVRHGDRHCSGCGAMLGWKLEKKGRKGSRKKAAAGA